MMIGYFDVAISLGKNSGLRDGGIEKEAMR